MADGIRRLAGLVLLPLAVSISLAGCSDPANEPGGSGGTEVA